MIDHREPEWKRRGYDPPEPSYYREYPPGDLNEGASVPMGVHRACTGYPKGCIFCARGSVAKPCPYGGAQPIYTTIPSEEEPIINVAHAECSSVSIPVILAVKGMDACPVCGESGAEGESFNTEADDRISQEMSCPECEAEWFNYYVLVRKDIYDVGISSAEERQ